MAANASKKPCQLYLVTGDDEPAIEARAEELFHSLAGEEPDDFAIDIVSEDDRGPRPDMVRQVLNAIQSPSFLGGRKTVWLKHFTGLAAEGRSKTSDPMGLKQLAARLAKPLPPDIFLVIDGPGCDARMALAKACAANGEVISCKKPDMMKRGWREEMAGCLQRVANAKGMTLSFEVREALTDALGGDTRLIEGELEKLLCYVGGPGKPITVDDVREVCSAQGEQQAWSLGDIVGKRDLAGTLSLIEKLLAQEKQPEGVARMLLLQLGKLFREYLALRLLMATARLRDSMALKNFLDGLPAEKKKAMQEEGLTAAGLNPWRATFQAEDALRFKPQELLAAIVAVRDALRSTVDAAVPAPVALENAVFKILN